MSSNWGGARPGAGAKKGGSEIPAKVRTATQRALRLLDELAADPSRRISAKEMLKIVEPALCMAIMASGDTKAKVDLLKVLKSYSEPLPSQKVNIKHTIAEDTLRAIWEDRRHKLDRKALTLNAKPDPEPSEPGADVIDTPLVAEPEPPPS